MRLITLTLYLTLAAYNALDVWQTHLLLEAGAKELNPLYVLLGEHMDMIHGIIATKVIMFLILGLLLFWWLR